MGLMDKLRGGLAAPSGHELTTLTEDARVEVARQFAVDETSIPYELFGIEMPGTPYLNTTPVTRQQALQVPAVTRAVDLICGTLSTIPLQLYDRQGRERDSSFLDQPEASCVRAVTMYNTLEDLFLHKVSWWRVLDRGRDERPALVEHLHKQRVQEQDGKVFVDGSRIATPNRDIIRFDGIKEGLLWSGARAIRTALRLEDAAADSASGGFRGFFSAAEDQDPADDEDSAAFTAALKEKLKTQQYVMFPKNVKFTPLQWSSREMQLVEGREMVIKDISRLTGVDADYLAVAVSSDTYANTESRRRDLLGLSPMAGLVAAVEQRLSHSSVTPQGLTVKFNMDAFLRSDTATRYEAHKVALEAGFLTVNEVREMENLPPLPAQAQAQPRVQAVVTSIPRKEIGA
jgi:Phage portal protein